MKKLSIITASLVLFASPLITLAQYYNSPYGYSPVLQQNIYNTSGGAQCAMNSLTLCTLINRIIGYLNQAIFLLIALSVVVFIYHVFKYFIQPNEDRKQAGMYVMYSIIGFFVILSLWGLVNILQGTFGLGNSGYSQNSWNNISNILPQ